MTQRKRYVFISNGVKDTSKSLGEVDTMGRQSKVCRSSNTHVSVGEEKRGIWWSENRCPEEANRAVGAGGGGLGGGEIETLSVADNHRCHAWS